MIEGDRVKLGGEGQSILDRPRVRCLEDGGDDGAGGVDGDVEPVGQGGVEGSVGGGEEPLVEEHLVSKE